MPKPIEYEQTTFYHEKWFSSISHCRFTKSCFSNPYSIEIYKTELLPDITKQFFYELHIDHLGFSYFETAKNEEKLITLKAAYFESADFANLTKSKEFTHPFKESNLINEIWKVKIKFDKKNEY